MHRSAFTLIECLVTVDIVSELLKAEQEAMVKAPVVEHEEIVPVVRHHLHGKRR